LDVDRAAALIRARRPVYRNESDSSWWIEEWTSASSGLLYCAECGANLILKVPASAAAPANPRRLPTAFYRCTGCPHTKASAKQLIGLVQDVVVRRWDNPSWLEQWCSAEIRLADDEIAENRELLAWIAAEPRKNMRTLVRASGMRRSGIQATLRGVERRMLELEGRRAALDDLQQDQRAAAERMASGKTVKGPGWRAGAVRPPENWWERKPTRVVWEVTSLARNWAESPSAQVVKRWSMVRSVLGDDRLQLTTDQRILLVPSD
jgi:hypothetical protein